MAAISLVYFYPDAMEGNVLRQHDMMQGAAVGHEAQVFKEQTGETTRWTNSLFSGMPTFQISPSYGSSALLSWIGDIYGLWLPSPANLLFMMMAGFFILLIACFNVIGSLSMLIIDKQKDTQTLRNLGADNRLIRRIFLFEGRLISLIGAVAGIALGLLLCFLQQEFGLVSLGAGGDEGIFVVDAYPVSVEWQDIVLVFFTVLAVGFLAVWYPIRYLSRKLLRD